MPANHKLSAKPSPANRKLSAKRSPSPTVASASLSKSMAHSFLGDCDDDDDFQPPRARPLKPCNGAAALRPRKKLKPSPSSSGKENGSAAGDAVTANGVDARAVKTAETLAAGSKASGGVPGAKKQKAGEIYGLSSYGSDSGKLGCKVKIGLDRYEYGKGNSSSLPNSIESRVLALGSACDLGVGRCEELQIVSSRYCASVPEEGHATGEVPGYEYDPPELGKKLSSSEALKGYYRPRLIKPRLLESDASCKFVIAGSYDSEGHDPGVLGPLSNKQNMDKANGVTSECGFGLHNGDHHLDSLESKLLMSNAKYDRRGCDCSEIQEPGLEACNLISQQTKVAAGHCASATPEDVTMENKSSGTDVLKGHCSFNSSESKLLESKTIHDFEADGYDNFEIGTQLSELINLCMKDSIEGQSNCSASPMEQKTFDAKRLKSDYEVKCPLCGLDISDYSEELRQLHTNNCLDEPAKESSLNHEKKPCAEESVEIRRAVEWLRNLGLSKYEEVFIREEVDWETLQWLTEEDLLGMGITSLGPRKKIIHALGELRKKHDDANETEDVVLNSENTNKSKLPINGNKLITQYFQCSSFDQRQRKVCKVKTPNLNEQKSSSTKIPTRRSAGKGKVKDTPLWCCIPGTPFRVDAFRYLRGDCSHWFLTHFHVDHYQGLTRSFCHGKIYCSSITASLVHHKIGIPWDRLHVLPLNEKINVAGINLTCFDANHCPGSIIILFEPPNGKAALHTGDFRFSSEMVNNPVLQSSHIHTLILDTTYCNPRYDFPSQEVVIQFVIEAIQAEAFNPKTLFLIGSYTIGKEKLFFEIARLLQKKIYVGAAKLQILKHLELPQEIMHWFTANEAESHIHVVPMWTLASFKRMKYLSNQYAGQFDLIVAFCPTGWAFGKGRKRTPGKRWQQGSIIRYEVPYSEHSSFTELQEFVKFISPEHIIPSVNNDGPESADAMLAQLLDK